MKKSLMAFLAFLFLGIVQVHAAEMVNVHIFKSSTCPHCSAALEFFDGLKGDNEYGYKFRLIAYEMYGNTDEVKENVALAKRVSKYFKEEFQNVPLIVIGNQKFNGYASSMDDSFKTVIDQCYQNSCLDVVTGIQNGTISENRSNTLIILFIFVVVLGGSVYFVYLARKNTQVNDFYEEEKKKEHMEKSAHPRQKAVSKTVHSKNTKKEVRK